MEKNYNHYGPKISIMLGGSSGSAYYPAIETWKKIIKSIIKNIPNSKIYLTGISKSKNGRTCTLAYTKKDLGKLTNIENIVDCYDIGLWNQISLMKLSDLFISPHTGFAFLAPCVNTPWLAISGGDWPEYFFNNVPFYSVFPDDKDYPYVGKGRWTKHGDKEHQRRIPTMSLKNLDKKIPEIVKYAKILIDKKLSYKDAVKLHVANIKKKGFDINKFGPLDDALGLDKLKNGLK